MYAPSDDGRSTGLASPPAPDRFLAGGPVTSAASLPHDADSPGAPALPQDERTAILRSFIGLLPL
jgi:hypothetical protein